MLGLLACVLHIARGVGRTGERRDSVPVLAGVERELFPAQLAAFPACVKRMPEDIPAASGLVDTGAELHLVPFVGRDPAADRSAPVDAHPVRR